MVILVELFIIFFFESILKNLKLITASKNLSNISKHKPLRIYPSEIDNEWRKI